MSITDSHTPDQFETAATRSRAIRMRRGAEHRRVREMSHAEGQTWLADVLLKDPPDWLGSAALGRVLAWPVQTGRHTTATTLARASSAVGHYIASEMRIDELTEDERDALGAILRGERLRPLVHVCASCGMEKHYTEFARHGNAGGGWRDHRGKRRRSWCRSCQRLRDQERYAGRTPKAPKGKCRLGPDRMLSSEPFAQWLERKCARYRLEHGEGKDAFANTLTISSRRLETYLRREQETVGLRVVDRVLTHEGSTCLFELYPELYPDEEVAE